ncbi:MAG TPA: protein kinase [Thermoanaerobaculia bacterium]|jgi:serine/threonine protein kinase/Tfp pilus assembly protein PilF|nr:protein kinase [Thermoanaerobaculia bacterium]
MFAAGSKVGPYEVLSLLGEGGMGQVYRGRDPRLGRDIAIKVLAKDALQDAEATGRLEREARAIAALSHPNIVAVYDVGREDSTFYLVTELLEGKTLRDALQAPMNWRRAVEIGAEVAEGLAAAHAKSIVHRDLKPENIFLTETGRVKILDFGLAQTDPVLSDRDEGNIPTTKWFQTQPGTVIGTLGYMSPEQLRGEAVDPSADLFSLGCILFEMVTLKKPFHRESGAATIAAILKDDLPRDMLGAVVPSEFQRIIEGCVEKSPSTRFQSARDLALTLRSIGSSATMVSDSLIRTITKRRTSKAIDSIAVLPLVNHSNDPNTEYLSDGITEGIINKLSQLPKLKVMARSTVFRYKGRDVDPQGVGRELRVRAVLTGVVKNVGERLQISVELVDSLDGAQLWGETYNRQLADLLTLQEEMSSEIADKLRPKLTGAEKKKLRRKTTENSEAYQLYLKGRYHWNKRTEESLRRGVQFFREAIESDPSFAMAYAGMADCFITMATNIPLPPHDTMPKAKAAAMRAIEIDDGLAEAWASLGAVRWWFDWDWEGAEEAYRRAIELNPNYANAHDGYAMLLSARGRFDEAVEQISKAADLDPLSLIIAVHAGWPFYFARDFESAIRRFRKALELDENFIPAHGWLGMALGQQHRYPEAIDVFARAFEVDRIPILTTMLAHTYAIAGDEQRSRELLTELLATARTRYVSPYDIAVIHAGLGDARAAIEQLQAAREDRSPWMVFLPVDPRLDSLRGEPAFTEIVTALH